MRYKQRQSSRMDDRRGQSAGPGMGAVGAGGVGGMGLIIALLVAFCGGDGAALGLDAGAPTTATAVNECRTDPIVADNTGLDTTDPRVDQVALIGTVWDNNEIFWTELFAQNGLEYCQSGLVLYEDLTSTGCGQGDARMGPFYCSLDKSIYIDMSFFDNPMFATQTDFGQAYVVAHEVGHHVQNLLGISNAVNRERQQNPRDSNSLSVRQELQADCFAGVWANALQTEGDVRNEAGIEIDESDIGEAIRAAESVGDDVIQQQMGGQINPDGFTHGTAEQRIEWFLRGFDTGNPESCDTFG